MAIFVFDAYGTLLDVNAAIARHRAAAGLDADRLSEIWRTKQLEYSWTLTLSGRYVDFWTLTERALDFALARVPSVDKTLKPQLLAAYQTLDAYPDARPILGELKSRGASTAILSNGTPGMLASALAAAKLEPLLDAVLSVDGLRIYKPRPEVYQLACDAFHVSAGDITFISANRWDVMGAQAFGFRTVWVNRTSAPNEYGGPSQTVTSLAELTRIDWTVF
jgi:2-haloacid dehalogenase